MAHNLDINDGVASLVLAREDAWHSLGTTLPDAFDAESALTYGHLKDWNLRKTPLVAELPGDNSIIVPDKFAMVRDNPVVADQVDFLGIVGSRYSILQNEALIELLDTLVDESGAHFETAGAIDGGRRVFVSMKLPGHLKIGGIDPVTNYIAATTSHDGSTATSIMVTPVRIVCQNTLNLAFQKAQNVFRVRHLSGSQSKLIGEARQTLDMSFEYLDSFQEEANRMLNTELSDNEFSKIIRHAFGPAEDAPTPTVTRRENQLAEMEFLFTQADTQKDVRNTVWGGLNAITEWADHFSPVRPGESGDEVGVRSRKALFDPYLKNQALSAMSALV